MTGREDALTRIAALAREHNLTADDIKAALAGEKAGPDSTPGSEKASPHASGDIAGRLFSYMGGIFVFSGVGLLISFMWEDIGSAQRVILTFGTGLACFILGTLAARDIRFEKGTTPLFLVGALMQPTGLFVFLNEYMPQSGNPELAAMMVFAAMAAQQALSFHALRRTSLLFFTFFFWNGFIGTGMDLMRWDGEIIGIILGASMLLLSWATGKTPHRAITPFWYFIGGATLLASWWSLVEGTPADLSYLALNAFLVYLSIHGQSRTLLLVSVLGLLGYMSYFAWEYFANVVGWPIALIFLGLAMMGLSAYAVKLGRTIGPNRKRNKGQGA